jgi:mycoredoxin
MLQSVSKNHLIAASAQYLRNSSKIMPDHYTLTPSQIVMYTTDYCSDCLRVKKFFEVNSIPHLRISVEGDDEATDFVKRVNKGYRSVPTIIFPDGTVLVEPSWEELKIKFVNS